MTPNQLKNSILQLAIQGKLTEEFRAQSIEHREDPFSQPNGCQLPQQQSFGGASSLAPTRSAPKKLGEVARSDERGLIDLSAEELLKQIQAEKAELIKQGKIKKDKNESTIIKRGNSYFEIIGTTEKCIDDELPFEIPDTWRWVRLGSLGITQTGNTPSKTHPEYQGKDIPFIGPGDIQNGLINYNNQKLSLIGKKYARIANPNSVLQVCIGGSIGKTAINSCEITFNQQINCITPIKVNYKYLNVVLSSSYIVLNMKTKAGGTATPIINRGIWDNLIIPIPPLAEQHRIVAKIEELLPMVEKYGEAYNKLETLNKSFPAEIKKSILQYAIQGKLTEEFRAQSEEHREDPFSQPNGCQLPQQQSFGGASSLPPTRSAPKKLGEESRSDERGLIDLSAEELLKQIQAEKAELIQQGKIKKNKNESTIIKRGNSYFEKVGTTEKCIDDELPFEIPDSWRWARLRNIVYNRPQKKPDKEFCYIDIGSIDNKKQCLSDNENIIKPENAPSRARKIISKGDIIYSTVRPYLHNMAIIDKDFSHEPIASTGFATMVSLINNKYLFNYLLSPEFDNYANSTDNSKGVAYPAINDEKLYKALIAIPPLAEQHRIVKKIEELFSFVDKLQK